MHVGIIGGGIIGLAVARRLLVQHPGLTLTVLEKEPALAAHQTGRNSGVVHAGLYYEPGSLKATLCRRGVQLLYDLAHERGLDYQECGKVVVAQDAVETERLERIHERAVANGVPGVALIDRDELARLEPHARGVAALHSPHTAIVDYAAVTRALAQEVVERGGRVRTGAEVTDLALRDDGGAVARLAGRTDRHHFDAVVLCGGLHSDRLAEQVGDDPEPRIIPFRGEYYRLAPGRTHLVNGLIYPVPDPALPFLGVHHTRTVDGEVLVGPNAVLALAREGYGWGSVDLADLRETLAWPGFHRLARRWWRAGAGEMLTSMSRAAFAREARRSLPELRARDLRRGPAGVRAQAVTREGDLVDDFWITHHGRVVALRNAPSPAGTAALAIAEHVGDLLPVG